MGMMDDLKVLMGMFMKDGAEIDGGIYFNYDQEHLDKMQEIIDEDTRFYYVVQKKAGLEPFEDNYSDEDTEIHAVNKDHFIIGANHKNRADELKKKVYDAIDEVYNKIKNKTIEQDEDLQEVDAQWEAMGDDMF